MNKKVLVLLIALLPSFPIGSQHLIGMQKEQLVKEMQTLYPNFVLDNSSVNQTYKYLKYTDKSYDQTFLIFFSDKDLCTFTKLMSDYSNLIEVKNDFNRKYRPTGKDQWTYTVNGVEYLVKLKQEEWFFSVITCKK